MSAFMPLQKITCEKQPNGVYKVTLIKAYSDETPVEVLIDGTTEYDVTYRNTSGASASLSSSAFNSVECSDGSSPDQYCQCIDEGFYHELPDVVRPDEVDTPVKLLLVYGDPVNNVSMDDSGIQSTATAEIDDEDFLDAVDFNAGTWVFSAVDDEGEVAWELDGEAVDVADYGITITGTAEEGDVIVVTNTHTIGDNIAATDVLDVAIAE